MTATAASPGRPVPDIPRAVLIAAAGIIASAAIYAGFLLAPSTMPADQWQHAARYTARVSALLFLLPFLIGPVAREWPTRWTLALRRRRRHLGLGFALAHFIHLYALVTYFRVGDEPVDPVVIAAGGFGYVLIALMALTSNDASVRALGGNWRRLHVFGLYYVWAIFTVTYAGRFSDPATVPVGIYGVGLFVAALALRLVLRRRHKRA